MTRHNTTPTDEPEVDQREAFVFEHAPAAADLLGSMGIDDVDISDGRMIADWVWCTFAGLAARGNNTTHEAIRAAVLDLPTTRTKAWDKGWDSVSLADVLSILDRAALPPAPANEARGGNTDNGLRAAWAHVVRDHDMPPNKDHRGYDYRTGWWDAVVYADRILTRGLRACADCPDDLDAAPAPTDNQRDDGLADRVRALADEIDREATSLEWASNGGEIVATAVKERRSTAIRLRAVVDGPTTPTQET